MQTKKSSRCSDRSLDPSGSGHEQAESATESSRMLTNYISAVSVERQSAATGRVQQPAETSNRQKRAEASRSEQKRRSRAVILVLKWGVEPTVSAEIYEEASAANIFVGYRSSLPQLETILGRLRHYSTLR